MLLIIVDCAVRKDETNTEKDSMKYRKTAIIYRLVGVLIIATLLIWAMVIEETSTAKSMDQTHATIYQISSDAYQGQEYYRVLH